MVTEQPQPSPREILIRMLTERYPEEVAEVLRELGYQVGEPAEPVVSRGRDIASDDSQPVLDLTLELLRRHDADAADIELEIPGEVWMGEATEPACGVHVGQQLLVNVHAAERCAGRPCVLHNPSDHHMRDWPLVWRGDRRIMERTCPHGIGHPDPDDMAYQRTLPNGDPGVHGCDGCC